VSAYWYWAIFTLVTALTAAAWAYFFGHRYVKAKVPSQERVDEALGLVLLPPLRVSKETAAKVRHYAARDGVIVQAYIRRMLDNLPEIE
jgi:hypothetical protein